MLRKLGIYILVFILIIYLYGYIYNYNRLNEIVPKIVGEHNIQYIDKFDSKLEMGGPFSKETYVFKISDTSRVNCKQLNLEISNNILSDFEKKYIDPNQAFCSQITSDEHNRTIQVLVQEDVLILNIFVD